MSDKKEYYSYKDLIERLEAFGLIRSERTVRHWAKEGYKGRLLKVVKILGSPRITPKEFDEWIEHIINN